MGDRDRAEDAVDEGVHRVRQPTRRGRVRHLVAVGDVDRRKVDDRHHVRAADAVAVRIDRLLEGDGRNDRRPWRSRCRSPPAAVAPTLPVTMATLVMLALTTTGMDMSVTCVTGGIMCGGGAMVPSWSSTSMRLVTVLTPVDDRVAVLDLLAGYSECTCAGTNGSMLCNPGALTVLFRDNRRQPCERVRRQEVGKSKHQGSGPPDSPSHQLHPPTEVTKPFDHRVLLAVPTCPLPGPRPKSKEKGICRSISIPILSAVAARPTTRS